MRHGRGKFDVSHAVAADLLHGHFNAALLTDDALVFHALVLAAQALIVLHRAKDPGTEKTITLGFEGTVIDGFGFFYLAMRPTQDLIRARKGDSDPVESRGFLALLEHIDQFLIHLFLFSWR